MNNRIRKGWICDTTKNYNRRNDVEFQLEVLQNLYTIIAPCGGIKLSKVQSDDRVRELMDELAVLIVGGIPEERCEFT